MRLDHVRSEIAYMRIQVGRHRREILQLQRAGISTTSADTFLQRMLDKIDSLCVERDKLKAEHPGHNKGRALGGRNWLKWFDDDKDHPPFIAALEDVRRRATQEG